VPKLQYANPFFRVLKTTRNLEDFYLIEESDYVCVAPIYNGSIVTIYEYKGAYARTIPNLITGSIETGESDIKAAVREIEEELFLPINSDQLTHFGKFVISPNRYFATVSLLTFRVLDIDLIPQSVRKISQLFTPSDYQKWFISRGISPPIAPSMLANILKDTI